ncbi:MAG: DUF4255 domain-containing protein [Chloroflexi bacterium]|nr:MAG: DUF4255 domain-containing protein [Chloroflexota bacterium]
MFDEIDETLRRLLIEEIPIRGNEIEIAFDQPRREWSARLNRPTLNIFLHDVRENAQLRQSYTQRQQPHPDRRQTALQRPEARVDLHYMITAWASEPDDEHRLLARTLLAFLRHREIPESFLPASLRRQPRPVALSVAQYDTTFNPPDLWGVMDNELRPCLNCMVTLTMDPHLPITVPLVRVRELRVEDMVVSSLRQQNQRLPDGAGGEIDLPEAEKRWTIGGRLQFTSLQNIHLSVLELERDVPVAADGTFVVGDLREGAYTLEVSRGSELPVRHLITVPSGDYDIQE